MDLRAKRIRRNILKMVYESGDGHVGCDLSAVDILVALYFGAMKIGPELMNDEKRDRFILSKGHAVAALYATLVERGMVPESTLDEYCRDGSVVASHATRAVSGIEVGTGSGGHGLPIGLGMALAARHTNNPSHIFVLCGDGEMAEGSMWEAAAVAGFHRFSNLTLIVDANGFQSEGTTKDIIDLSPFDEKFHAFRWDTTVVDGHDIKPLQVALTKKTERPHVVIANTTKGKGVSFMENMYDWHHIAPSKEQYEAAMKELS